MTTTTKTNGNTAKRNTCLCGCGTKVRAHFAQGHDQRFRGFVLRVSAGTADKREAQAVTLALKAGLVLKAVREANAPVLRASAA